MPSERLCKDTRRALRRNFLHERGEMICPSPPWLIFDSRQNQAIDRERKRARRRGRGTTLRISAVDQASAIWRRVGGRATPRAASARLATGRGAERKRKRLPSCSTSVSVSESRSAITAGQEAPASAARRSSSSFFSTSARKLQATWPRIVSSSL